MRFISSPGLIVWIAAAWLPVAPLAAQRDLVKPVTETALLVTLPAPAGLVVRTDPAALVFSWQPVTGAVGYQIDAAPALAGPWTALVPAPIPSATFSYSPPAGALTYYRVAAVHTVGIAGSPAIIPFIFNPPLVSTSVSAAQSGSNLIVSWNPVAGATGYGVQAQTVLGSDQLQVFNPGTSATFTGLMPAGQNGRLASFTVAPQFPRGAVTPMFAKRPMTAIPVFDPSVCWPPAGETPGGPAPAALVATPSANVVGLAWIPAGQVLASRVERALAGSGQWESLACLGPMSQGPFVDYSIALRPSTGYAYRVTSIGPGGVTGTSIATVVTPAPAAPIVSAGVRTVSYSGGGSTHALDLSLQGADWYLISSSYGYRAVDVSELSFHSVVGVPSGTHSFTVTTVYRNGVLGGGTTIAVTVP